MACTERKKAKVKHLLHYLGTKQNPHKQTTQTSLEFLDSWRFKILTLEDLGWGASCSILISVCNTQNKLEQKKTQWLFLASIEHDKCASCIPALHGKTPWRESSAHSNDFHPPIVWLSNSGNLVAVKSGISFAHRGSCSQSSDLSALDSVRFWSVPAKVTSLQGKQCSISYELWYRCIWIWSQSVLVQGSTTFV